MLKDKNKTSLEKEIHKNDYFVPYIPTRRIATRMVLYISYIFISAPPHECTVNKVDAHGDSLALIKRLFW